MALAGKDLGIWLLVLTRLASFMVVSPLWAWRGIPALAKVGFAVALSLLLWPVLTPAAVTWSSDLELGLLVLKESVVGLALGLAATISFNAIRAAGELMDVHLGLSMVNLFDPQMGEQVSLLGQFLNTLAMLLFLTVDGHHYLLLALADSFRLLPLGQASFSGPLALTATTLVSGMFSLGFRLAAPVVALLVVSDLALAMVARTVPQLNVFMMGFPLKLGLGMVVLALSLPVLAVAMGGIFQQLAADLTLIARGLQ